MEKTKRWESIKGFSSSDKKGVLHSSFCNTWLFFKTKLFLCVVAFGPYTVYLDTKDWKWYLKNSLLGEVVQKSRKFSVMTCRHAKQFLAVTSECVPLSPLLNEVIWGNGRQSQNRAGFNFATGLFRRLHMISSYFPPSLKAPLLWAYCNC